MKVLAILLFISSCASLNLGSSDAKKKLSVYTNHPGEVLKISFPKYFEKEGTKLLCNSKEFPFYEKEGSYISYIVESYWSQKNDVYCFLLDRENQSEVIARFKIKEKKFPSERIYVNPRRVKLSKKDQARASREQKVLNKIYATTHHRPYFDSAFVTPIKSKITSIYGAQRVFNGEKKTQHLGTDFRARIGTPIKAANSGRVVFAGDLFYTGKTVIVDHGLGIFTNYGHLSALKSVVGEVIPRGAVVGKSGNTGRSSGPHLHWGVKVHGQYIDGYSLIRETLK